MEKVRRHRSVRQLLGVGFLASTSVLGVTGGATAAVAHKTLMVVNNCQAGTPSLPGLPDYVAADKGFFAQEGVTVNFVTVSSALTLPSILSGACMFGTTSPASIMAAVAAGQPLTIFGSETQRLDTNLIINAATARAKGITAKSTLAEKIQALRGLTVASTANGNTNNDQLRYLLAQYGLNYQTDVKATYLSQTAELPAVLNNTVQAVMLGSPTYQQAIGNGGAQMLVNFTAGEVPVTKGMPQGTFYTTPNILSANRQAFIGYSAGLDKALAYIRNLKNLKKVAAIADKYITGIDPTSMQNYIHHLVLEGVYPANTTEGASLNAFDKWAGLANAVYASQGQPGLHYTYKQMVDPTIATLGLKKAG